MPGPSPPSRAKPDMALGAFTVGRDGRIAPRGPDHPAALRFAWRGRPCTAVLEADGLGLSAEAGRVPYTVEAPRARGAALETLARLPAELPPGWALALRPDHRIRLAARAILPGAATATGLVAAMVHFVLALDPYLERLEASGLAAAPSAPEPGRSST
ncbi:hypothetical protein LPC08_05145 [Roseomonas sp. OT10]|uniref:hypothetical protein n=1 Tax=Roseomonas cutis TaxID=2897332 RepID=UPI001E4AF089|nr:hypothetical protein [Roseomonas sp. OT10]UFN50026.1 hypothetical protein LPC08_05145 [Roseomonas sp. OT10]